MYFAPPPNIWFDYQSNIGKIRLWKSLVEDTPNLKTDLCFSSLFCNPIIIFHKLKQQIWIKRTKSHILIIKA